MTISAAAIRNCFTLNKVGFYLFAGLIALGPLHSKILGAALILFYVCGLYLAFTTRKAGANTKLISSIATSIWLKSCLIALLLAGISALIWHEKIDTFNAQFKLLFTAAAAVCIARYQTIPKSVYVKLHHALAFACVLAFLWVLFLIVRHPGVNFRAALPSNAIAWAAVISFYICLLLPAALCESRSAGRQWFWLVSVGCGIAAILLSESRGSFLIIPWFTLVCACFLRQKYAPNSSLRRALALCSTVVVIVLAGAWFGPGDVLRMHQAAQDIKQIQTSENYNTSIGARIFLWNLALDGFRTSPWIGIGSVERIRRIRHAGEGGTAEQVAKLQTVRPLNYVHNQYLHAALDGGLIGLASFLTLLLGLSIVVCRLAGAAPIAAWQLGGVLFMHATASLTNVNFVHNYYATALSLAVVFPLLSSHLTARKTGNIICTY